MDRMWATTAKIARIVNRMEWNKPQAVVVSSGSNITPTTTNSAYPIRKYVNIAQVIPSPSHTNHRLEDFILLTELMLSFAHLSVDFKSKL
jgi:hypothetical protein